MAAFFTIQGLNTDIESLEDLIKRNVISYAPIYDSEEMHYFKRLADIEARFHTIWKEMSLNDSLTQIEKTKMAIWEYPVYDKYTKIWRSIKKTGMPKNLEQAIYRIRNGSFALMGHFKEIAIKAIQNCDLIKIPMEFAKRDYAIGLQQGSPLKQDFDKM